MSTELRTEAGVGEVEAEDPSTGRVSLQRNSLLTMASSVAVGIANYGFSLALVWILDSRSFAIVASVNSLLVVVGTAGAAALPWLVARQVAAHPARSEARREAVAFALAGSLLLGLITTAIVVAIASTYAGAGVLVALSVTTMALFVGAPGIGFLQGSGRFGLLAVIAVVEASLKVGLGAGLAAAGLGPTGAVAGAALGALMLAGAGLYAVRSELAWPRLRVEGGLWKNMAGIGGIQVSVSVLATLDVVVASVIDGSTRAFAGYQAMLVFARVPLFVSIALSFVVYPRLSKASPSERNAMIRQTTLLYFALCVVTVAVVASLPSGLLGLVLPHGYASFSHLLLPLALAGLGAGTVNLVTTYLQAEGVFGPAVSVMVLGLILAVILESRLAHPVGHLAWAACGADLTLAAVLVALAARRLEVAALWRMSAIAGLAIAATCAILLEARSQLGLWSALVALALAVIVLAARPRRRLASGSLLS